MGCRNLEGLCYSLKGVYGALKRLVFTICVLQVQHTVLGHFDGQFDVLLNGHRKHGIATVINVLPDKIDPETRAINKNAEKH